MNKNDFSEFYDIIHSEPFKAYASKQLIDLYNKIFEELVLTSNFLVTDIIGLYSDILDELEDTLESDTFERVIELLDYMELSAHNLHKRIALTTLYMLLERQKPIS